MQQILADYLILVSCRYKDLEVREKQALARMRSVNELITGRACLARTLAEHFGDSLPDKKQECGHCTWCETKSPVQLVSPPKRSWDSAAFSKILQACSARDDPRFLARVAFGIQSPRVTKEKLNKDKVFGSMEDHDFMVCSKCTRYSHRHGATQLTVSDPVQCVREDLQHADLDGIGAGDRDFMDEEKLHQNTSRS